jgi:hypothetical protein
MDQQLDWTERLGDAFLSQPTQVMDTIQNLRQRAYAAGNLKYSDQIYVEPGQDIVVEYANPEVIYVPYYSPTVIYGTWWWPAYPPVYWKPWPGYHVGPVVTVGFFFGIGVPVAAHFFFGACDWHAGRVAVLQVNNRYFNYNTYVNRQKTIYRVVNVTNRGVEWGHDPVHLRGVPYRTLALRQEFNRVSVAPETRRDFRGYAQSPPRAPAPTHVAQSAHPEAVQPRKQPEEQHAKIIVGSTGAKPSASTTRPAAPAANVNRVEPHAAPTRAPAPATQPKPTAFEDVEHGAQVRDYSERGRESIHPAASQSGTPAKPAPAHKPTAQPSSSMSAPQQSGSSSGGGTVRH